MSSFSFSTDVDEKFEHLKIAVLRQNAGSDLPVEYNGGVHLPESLIQDFKFQGVYEYHLFKRLYRNHVDEIEISPSVSFDARFSDFIQCYKIFEFTTIINFG